MKVIPLRNPSSIGRWAYGALRAISGKKDGNTRARREALLLQLVLLPGFQVILL